MKDFERYCGWLTAKASQKGYDREYILQMIDYARQLDDRNLPVIYDQEHLSLLMGIDYSFLLGISNKKENYYKIYHLPKRHGGFRVIMEPYPTLKYAQDWILKFILNPIREEFVAKNAKAYMPGRSVKDNAKLHCNKRLVFNIDLKDFFGTISFKMVLDFFLFLGYTKEVAVMLSNLCICYGSLPQGAPTSPMLSNMIFKPIDEIIFTYCRSNRIIFSRYADDMTFSGEFDKNRLLSFLNEVLYKNGFYINHKKIKTYSNTQRQLVTNIVVNDRPHVRRKTLRTLRQEAYYISKYGISQHLTHINSPFAPEHYLKRILGKINYALFLNPKDTIMETAKYQIYKEIYRFAETKNITVQDVMSKLPTID